MANYRVLISSSTAPGTFIAELPVDSLSFTETLNDAGSASVSMPLRIQDPDTLQVVTDANLDTVTTLLWLERDGELVWGGIVWGVSGDAGANSLTINASGFHSYVRRRVIRHRINYASQDQLYIPRSLLAVMQATTGSLNIINTSQSTLSGVTVSRLYNYWDRKPYGEAIEQLASVEDGFDFSYEATYDADGSPSVEFVTTYPALGRQTKYVLDINSNVEALSFSRDGSARSNEVDALGSGEGPGQLIRTRTNPAALAEEPLLQSVITVSDVTRASTLSAHAGRELSRGSQSAVQYTVQLDPGGTPPQSSYKVGDIVELRADYGYLDDSGSYRIVQKNVASGSGGEVATLTLASLELFADI